MKKVILLSSVLLAAPFMMNGKAQAADCVTQDCPTLGYTSVSNTGNCVKCPFGNFWACPKGNSSDGENEEKAILGQCTGYAKKCNLGDILNSDGTCTTNKVSGKTPIAIVIYLSGNCGEALALQPIGSYQWGNGGAGAVTVTTDGLDSCPATKKVISAGTTSDFPAAWAAYNYGPSNTKGKWCLPSMNALWGTTSKFHYLADGLKKVGINCNNNSCLAVGWTWTSTTFAASSVKTINFYSESSSGGTLIQENVVWPIIQF